MGDKGSGGWHPRKWLPQCWRQRRVDASVEDGSKVLQDLELGVTDLEGAGWQRVLQGEDELSCRMHGCVGGG